MERVDKANKNKTYVGWLSEEEIHQKELNSERILGIREGIEQGIQEGENLANIATAKNLLKMNNLSIEDIARATGLDIEQVKELKCD